jgi:hypothetical protein
VESSGERVYNQPESPESEQIPATDFLASLQREPVVDQPADLRQYLQGYNQDTQLERIKTVREQAHQALMYDGANNPVKLSEHPQLPFISDNRTLFEDILVRDEQGDIVDMEQMISDDDRFQAINSQHKRFSNDREIVATVKTTRMLVAAELFMREFDS